jgi:hypothetical protein
VKGISAPVVLTPNLIRNFWSKVPPANSIAECWEWQGRMATAGLAFTIGLRGFVPRSVPTELAGRSTLVKSLREWSFVTDAITPPV